MAIVLGAGVVLASAGPGTRDSPRPPAEERRLAVLARRHIALAVAAVNLAACASAQQGEALIFIDTDLEVPRMVSRLRVDVFSLDGTWYASRDFDASLPSDWPLSFSVYSDDGAADKEALVRLRAYPADRVRPYRGERFRGRPSSYAPPPLFHDLESACAAAPTIGPGQQATRRIEVAREWTSAVAFGQGECARQGGLGARSAVAVRLEEPGRYRFGVIRQVPASALTGLQLRRDCLSEARAVDCRLGLAPDGSLRGLAQIERSFGASELPLTLWMIPFGRSGQAVDVTLAVVPGSGPWPPPAPSDDLPTQPLLLANDGQSLIAPGSEPEPTTAVDRLVRVRVQPHQRGAARVLLAAVCDGTQARLSDQPPYQRPAAAGAATCVATEGVLEPVGEAALDPDLRLRPSRQGSFRVDDPCDERLDPATVCIPGGVFLLGGDPGYAASEPSTPSPNPGRPAALRRFDIDRHEVSVAEFRRAWPALASDHPPPGTAGQHLGDVGHSDFCSWTPTATDRDPDYALSCVSLETAQAYCQLHGGSLPTEAQWEYAASMAGRARKTRYPWGDEDPDCSRAIYARDDIDKARRGLCLDDLVDGSDRTDGPQPLAAREQADLTPLQVVGMGGGLDEWVRDAPLEFDADCWRAAPLAEPSCEEPRSPVGLRRGGDWFNAAEYLRSTTRNVMFYPGGEDLLGFRCVYPHGGRTP